LALSVHGAPLECSDDVSARIPDEYIIIYKEEAGNEAIWTHQTALSRNIMHTYNISQQFRGFSAHLAPEELGKVLDSPFVKSVHCNGMVHLFCDADQSPTTSWGLARVCTQGGLDGPLNYRFLHHGHGGRGTNIYILDTGCFAEHEQFNGRVAPGANFVTTEPPATVDQNGHGTHCAGTIAGNTYGIARNARIVPVKVLGRTGGGTWAGVIAGINWCANDYNQPMKIPSIGSMSLGGGRENSVNAAVEAAIAIGLQFSIAAGNSRADACNFSPASANGAICVGATNLGPDDDHDIPSVFSNHGSCVKIWAPGTDIPSSYIPNSNSYAVLSGTSMAAPHVAGICAVILAKNPSMTPPQLMEALETRFSNSGVIQNPLPGPNLLIWNGCNDD